MRERRADDQLGSSASADENSRFLYMRSKGETESRLRQLLQNPIPSLSSSTTTSKVTAFRPGFLELVEERESPRLAESLFGMVIKPFRWIGVDRMSASVIEVAIA